VTQSLLLESFSHITQLGMPPHTRHGLGKCLNYFRTLGMIPYYRVLKTVDPILHLWWISCRPLVVIAYRFKNTKTYTSFGKRICFCLQLKRWANA
jgi:hypothetical protein